MGSELLLYGYGIVCISMLAFNIVYNISQKKKDRRLEKKSRRFEMRVDRQLSLLRAGEPLERGHTAYLCRKLSHVGSLAAFDRLMSERMDAEDSWLVGEYRRQIQPVILHLAMVYRKRDDMQAAYFAYFLSRHSLKRHMAGDAIQCILVEYMDKESLYCRVNALQALYEFGSPESIVEAVTALDRSGRFFHDKILTDGLLSFTGSHDQLIQLLLEQFSSFTIPTKLAVLNYIRFRSGDYCEWILTIMSDPDMDKELRLSAIRYEGKYVYSPAKPALLAFASDKNPLNWEYASISASALANYEGSDVLDVLMSAVYSSNWYVRGNAAASLEAHGLDYSDLIEVVGGGDRYVREMMLYQLDLRRMRQESRGAAV